MTEMISDHDLLKLNVQVKLRKLIQKEKKGYQASLHRRCGVGLTAEDFSTIVQKLVDNQWVTLHEGTNGGVILQFNEVFNDVNLPEFKTTAQE